MITDGESSPVEQDKYMPNVGTTVLFVFLIFVTSFSGTARAKQVFTGMEGNIRLPEETTRVVFGRVTRVMMPARQVGVQIKLPFAVAYDVEVRCEYQRAIMDGAAVRIEGRYGVQGSAPINIPLLDVGDLFVMAVKITPDKGRFVYAGEIQLPIGVETPQTINPDSAENLKIALLRLGEIAGKDGGIVSRQAALALIEEKNAYLWAIGVVGLAEDGTANDVQLLMQCYEDEQKSISQILWVEYCFQFIFPAEVRPTLKRRHDSLLYYLHRATLFGKAKERKL